MQDTSYRAIAIVGAGAILPDAPNVGAFWKNITDGRYSITEVTPDRWDPHLYFDPDRNAPDKTYSKIGGWVREYPWEPFQWKLNIPPRVSGAMDEAQRWAIACAREALEDYGYPKRPLNAERTAVILGNAMAGEKHYLTALRAFFPEYARELDDTATFAALSDRVRREITREWHARIGKLLPPITEDSMPGELSNCLAGRVANTYNFRGPNFVCDAACASAMAAIRAAMEGLINHDFDVALTGGVDRNMGAPTFVKFCKIGALSGTGSRPYAEGADGFVMGEGAALLLLKRLVDAERDGDKIYAVLRGMGGSSDGKGKGITAPNPAGQKICIERAWENAGFSPVTATMFEGHGTSTSVGDAVEVESLANVLQAHGSNGHRIALGSVKSNFGHLKGASGAAGILKTSLALHNKLLPPSVHCEHPNSHIDFAHSPLYVNTELRSWTDTAEGVRRAGVSAFGFGGTNFHAVLEEYIPGRLNGRGKHASAAHTPTIQKDEPDPAAGRLLETAPAKMPLRGALVIGAASESELAERLRSVQKTAEAGRSPERLAPRNADLRAPERIAIDYGNAAELVDKCGKALAALKSNQAPIWKALRAQGIFRGHGPAPKVAFLYTGQGSQYVNMLRTLRAQEPIVARTFEEADRVMTPLLGKPLSQFVFVDPADGDAVAKAEEDLRQTAITQPAVLATDEAMTLLLEAYGIQPDLTMGHSLGEYGALVAAGALPFEDALEAVSARGREMTRVSMADNGRMAAVFAPLREVERILKSIDGYVVIANINSDQQVVIGGASAAVDKAVAEFLKANYNAVPLPVSHAFHTAIVAPASAPLREVLERLRVRPVQKPVVANVDGEFYPTGADTRGAILDILSRQISAPVQFIKGLQTLYAAGARVFVEMGPKKALYGFVEDVLGSRGDVLPLFTNHPKLEDATAFNQALCGLYASGHGNGSPDAQITKVPADVSASQRPKPVVITGASLGLPGVEQIFDDSNLARILKGDRFIDVIPTRYRQGMLDKHITRLVKSDKGDPVFEQIRHPSEVIRLAARGGRFELDQEFGVSTERVNAFDRTTQLAVAAGIDALRDAGLPLIRHYKLTRKGTRLPDRWALPDALRDDTGVIFASAFPGYDSFAHEIERYHWDRSRRERMAELERLRERGISEGSPSDLLQEIDRRISELKDELARDPYLFNRRFLLRTLPMGHSQFAELIGARGPNTHVNSACASTATSLALAEDWIRAGRCARVIIVSADDITSDHLLEWFGAGFLASGAAATDDLVEEAAIPFDRRRHGMIIGMGAAGLVVESAESAAERGLRPICEVLGAVTRNSAYHPTRLDIEHISGVMEEVVRQAESRSGVTRSEFAASAMFMSHETYTPARGGSASAEVHALREVFSKHADKIVIANTKGLTGHAMGTGIEDVVAVKALETGWVPPVPNFKEVDPELGVLNLSRGGAYPVEYALRLGAGFGSQISMTVMRRIPSNGGRPSPNALGYAYRVTNASLWKEWLRRVAGREAVLEVVQRTLRFRDEQGAEADLGLDGLQKSQVPQTRIPSPLVDATPDHLPAMPMEKEPVEIASQADPVEERLLSLVMEKTGYPREMLNLELDLEADLGIDTVKQAEMFAAIREIYGITRDPNLKLREFSTLARVMQFVHERRPDLKQHLPSVTEVSIAISSPPPTPTAVPATSEAAVDGVGQTILNLVVEKTGYPKDMLDLNLDLEADLGVDTVKQAEMFAAIREIYAIPRDNNLNLRDFSTLARVIQFVYDRRPDLRGATTAPSMAASVPAAPSHESMTAPAEVRPAPPPPVSSTPPKESGPTDEIRDQVLEIISTKTGYPREMLDPDLDLEADLGIDTVKQAEIFTSIRELYQIPRDETFTLREFPTLQHVFRFVRERRPGSPVPAPSSGAASGRKMEAPLSEETPGIKRRVPVPVLRPALDYCKDTGVKLTSGDRVLVMPDHGGVAGELIMRLQARGIQVEMIAPDSTPSGPVQGVYWLPALDHEGDLKGMSSEAWHAAVDVRVKAFYRAMKTVYDQVAGAGTFLISATRLGGLHGYGDRPAFAPLGGAVTGFTKTYKRERPDVLVKAVDFEADRDSAQIADALIAETLRDPGAVEIGYTGATRWTIGLEEQPRDTARPGMRLNRRTVFVVTGAAGSIVSAITSDLAAASAGTFYLLDLAATPNPSAADLKKYSTDRDGLRRELFERIQARGERATPALVEKELAGLERQQAAWEAIQAIRASGGTAYYYCVDLTDRRGVARVIDDVRHRSGRIDVLIHAAGIERSHALSDKEQREFDLVFDVKANGFFHLLNAIGDMPVGAIVGFSSIAGRFGNAGQTDYSAANDLLCKMASSFRSTRPETRTLVIDWTAWSGIGMASRGSIPKVMEMAGIQMLPPETGVPWIRHELAASSAGGEVVVAGSLGALRGEWDASGGVDADRFPERLMIDAARVSLDGCLTIECTLDPTVQPFLRDHAIEGTPLLPGVMGIEAFAEAALSIGPGWHVEAIEDIDFLTPLKFYRCEPRVVTVEARFRPDGDQLVAFCRLLGRRQLSNQAEQQVTTHFTGRVRLSRQEGDPLKGVVPGSRVGSTVEESDIYRLYFHGPAYRVLKRVWWDKGGAVGVWKAGLPDDHIPATDALIAAPRTIELCLQTAGLWEIGERHRMGLPRHIDAIRFNGTSKIKAGPLYAVVTPRPSSESFDAEVLDRYGRVYLRVSGYGTVLLREDVSLKEMFTQRPAAV